MIEDPSAHRILVVLTVDTEPDNVWRDHLNPSVANVYELPRLQELLSRYGARATFLLTYRVVQNSTAVGILRSLVAEGGAEVGAHLHPWENPPFMASRLDVEHHTYPHELPLDVFAEKCALLTREVARRFGPPTSYRGGRWGLSGEHIAVLERLGYEVDSSVTPLVDWRGNYGVPASRDGRGGIDYRQAPHVPYHPDYEMVARRGGARITEVPVGARFSRNMPQPLQLAYQALPEFARRVLRKCGVLRVIEARPALEKREHLVRLVKQVCEERTGIINIALHSSELMVGGSPKSLTGERVNEIFERIRVMLDMAVLSGVCGFATLTEAARWWMGCGVDTPVLETPVAPGHCVPVGPD